MEERKLNVSFAKTGNGYLTTRIILPITDLREMGVTEKDREVTYSYDKENKQIIIKKAK